MLKTDDPYRFIEIVKGEDLVKIYVQADITSLCTLKMLSGILSKEYVKHEAIFIENNQSLELDETKFIYLWHGRVEEGEKENSPPGVHYVNYDIHNTLVDSENRIEYYKEQCGCADNNIDTLINIFYLCKALNYCTEDTLWSVLIPVTFYKTYLFADYNEVKPKEDEDSFSESSEDLEIHNEACNVCRKLQRDISFEVKKIDGEKKDGLVYKKGLKHPLVGFTDIYASLKHDIHFVIINRLLYKKRKDIEDMKIKTYLAHKGVSIKSSQELYSNLPHSTKKFLLRNFQSGYQYYQMKRRALIISAVDMALFLNFFLFKYKTTEAYLVLTKHTSLTSSKTTTAKCVGSMFEIISQIKQSLTAPIKHENVIIYKIKNILGIQNVDCYIRFLYDIFGVYIRARHGDSKFVVVLDTKNEDLILYGVNVDIGSLKLRGILKIDRKRFYRIVVDEER
ncbi:hypothetical protein NGRA_1317 [Nosema granulosis]|uniref:Uncharacterized protein n=1 Tax=Nosema granulosis TaxID=83296 RepID=A0A9P6GYQ7_9MICR|nr:hypothetical protein NGRA_1317 [Nosema granulosis]